LNRNLEIGAGFNEQFYLTLTTNCNLACEYCYGKSCEDFGSDFHDLQVDYSIPSSVTYTVQTLKNFLRSDPAPVLIFYGGEPLLETPKMKQIMDAIPAARFVLQTNALLLDQVEADYVNKFDSIFVSLDGDEEISDYYRGRGTYKRVVQNINTVLANGFKGEIVARMTVGEETEIDKQVMALIQNPDLPVSSVHWQLDALFWQNDFATRNFSAWAEENYNPRLRQLISFWVECMRKNGQVLKLYPLVGLTQSLLRNEPTRLRCGAGWSLFNIQTDGNVTPCPVMAGLKDFYVGNIRETNPNKLRSVSVSEPCTTCDISQICGGRCLYANVTKLWGEEGFAQVCSTVRNLVEALNEALPSVRALIDAGIIHLDDFEYQKYNGCEIVP
jgi:putative peptide-modifying radical SAM enzyme